MRRGKQEITFAQLVKEEKVGFWMALKLYFKKFGKLPKTTFGFREWLLIYDCKWLPVAIRVEAWTNLNQQANTPGDLSALYWRARRVKEKSAIANRARAEAKSFEEWQVVWNGFKPLRRLAWKKMQRLAGSFSQWAVICNGSVRSSSVYENALREMSKLAQNYEEWLEIYRLSTKGHELETLALNNMKQLGLLADWLKLYSDVRFRRYRHEPDQVLTKTAVAQMEVLVKTLSDWRNICEATEFRDSEAQIYNLALKKCKESARTVKDWQRILELTQWTNQTGIKEACHKLAEFLVP